MSLPEIGMDFNQIEREIFCKVCTVAREMVRGVLGEWDEELAKRRDMKEYRHKGKKKTVYRTIFGEVEYRRNVYEVTEDGIRSTVYLLDEAMGMTGTRRMSGLLTGLIVKASCEAPYRSAARAVSEMTGQTISHMAVWNVVQAMGKQVDEQEQRASELAAKDEGIGTIETPILFEEQDGIYLHLQGKDRKGNENGKEMKVAIAYDGAKKNGKKRYELTNKVACANFEGIEEFVKRKEGVIAEVYNVDEIERRILGGDGASWIRSSQTDETVQFQLDAFHRNKAVLECVSDREARKKILKLLYAKEIDLMLNVIETYALSTDDEKEREGYERLHGYFQNNADGLVPYQVRGQEIPKPPEGKEYRFLGAMESNIYTIIGNRMKGGRACWSIKGGNNLARMLCLYHTKKLTAKLGRINTCILPERYEEEVTVKISAAKVPMREGKGYNGYHQFTVPSSMMWLKDIARIKTVLSH